jgi:cleavage and polyadenylation specificity factor subunit 3
VILVHGEQNEMLKFKTGFERHFENDAEYNFQMYNPANLEELEFYFRGEKMAKVIGRACSNIRDLAGPATIDGTDGDDDKGATRARSLVGTVISGLLVNPVSTFNYHIYDPSELTEHTDLKTSQLEQQQVVAFPHGFPFLEHFMQLMHGNVVKSTAAETLDIVGKVKMVHSSDNKTVTLKVCACHLCDRKCSGCVVARRERQPVFAYPCGSRSPLPTPTLPSVANVVGGIGRE